MLDRLATELIDLVLEQLDFGNALSAHSRRLSLHSCLLVSKKLSALARPLLWQDLHIEGDVLTRLSRIQRGQARSEGRKTRSLRVDGEDGEESMEAIMVALQGFPNVEELNLSLGPPQQDLHLDKLFELLPALAYLHLSHIWLRGLPQPVTFTSLTSLSLYTVAFFNETAVELFTPHALPALRALAFSTKGGENWSDFGQTIVPLLSQLDFLQTHGLEASSVAAADVRERVRQLFTVIEDDSSARPAQGGSVLSQLDAIQLHSRPHLRYLLPHTQHNPFTSIAFLRSLIDLYHPRSLSLPNALRRPSLSTTTSSSSPPSPPSVVSLEDLVDRCSVKDVQVLWFEQEDESEYSVSPSFWRYIRRTKAEDARGEAAAAEGR